MRVRDNELMKSILRFINETYFKEGYIPTYREIASVFSISTSSAYRNVKYLEENVLLKTSSKGNNVITSKMQKSDRIKLVLNCKICKF